MKKIPFRSWFKASSMSAKQKQWTWFVSLWCAGVGAALLLSYGARWVVFN
jgi:hypothetical protein